jgi:hypothetical protein
MIRDRIDSAEKTELIVVENVIEELEAKAGELNIRTLKVNHAVRCCGRSNIVLPQRGPRSARWHQSVVCQIWKESTVAIPSKSPVVRRSTWLVIVKNMASLCGLCHHAMPVVVPT